MAKATKLKSGNWNVQVFVGLDENGKKIRKSFTAPTRWEAEKMADEFIKNGKKEEQKLTVEKAIEGYITLKENVLAPSTIRGYRNILANRFGSIMQLDVHEVNSLNLQLAINEEAKTVGWKSIHEAKNLLLTSLKMYGVKPDIHVTLPAKKHKIKNLPSAEKVIEAVRGSDVELACLLAIWLSFRISEVRGLQFGDISGSVITVQRSNVDLAGKDTVREVNKTYESTRQLAIPAYIRGLIDKVPHTSKTDYVVPMSYKTVRNHFNKLLRENGLSMKFHDLRHLNASVMLMLGIPDKYAMERGGWSTNHTLKSVYQHTFSEERKLVDEKIDNYFNSILGI